MATDSIDTSFVVPITSPTLQLQASDPVFASGGAMDLHPDSYWGQTPKGTPSSENAGLKILNSVLNTGAALGGTYLTRSQQVKLASQQAKIAGSQAQIAGYQSQISQANAKNLLIIGVVIIGALVALKMFKR
jgi:hypothetical protein